MPMGIPLNRHGADLYEPTGHLPAPSSKAAQDQAARNVVQAQIHHDLVEREVMVCCWLGVSVIFKKKNSCPQT
jgi:hypothetical protein